MDSGFKYNIINFSNDLGLDIEEVSKLYAELIYELNLALLELRILMHEHDLTKIQKIIHNIKGVSGNYRIISIYEESSKINDFLKANIYNNPCNNLEKDLNNLFYICDITLTEIKTFFHQKSIAI